MLHTSSKGPILRRQLRPERRCLDLAWLRAESKHLSVPTRHCATTDSIRKLSVAPLRLSQPR